jgi:hypothetical protein
MSVTLNPHIAIRYEKAIHRDLLVAYTQKTTSKNELISEWEKVINGNSGEPEVQKFLERHPYMLPGLYDYQNGPRRGVIVSQLPLTTDYKTDFAFVTLNSMMLQFTFIEIEDPAKQVFNEDLSFTQSFNKALQQVRDWKRWAEGNIPVLLNMYADLFENYNVQNDHKSVRCYLVCGRRDKIQWPQLAKERWSSLQSASSPDIIIMTYNRLSAGVAILPTDQIRHDLAVCTYRERGFFFKAEVLQDI